MLSLRHRRWYLLAMVLVVLALMQGARGDNPRGRSYVGHVPPELVSRAEHWLNADKPLELRQFKGRVVWLSFNF